MMDCQHGDACDGKGEAQYMCESCETKYCKDCAQDYDYECDCEPPPSIVKIIEEASKKGAE